VRGAERSRSVSNFWHHPARVANRRTKSVMAPRSLGRRPTEISKSAYPGNELGRTNDQGGAEQREQGVPHVHLQAVQGEIHRGRARKRATGAPPSPREKNIKSAQREKEGALGTKQHADGGDCVCVLLFLFSLVSLGGNGDGGEGRARQNTHSGALLQVQNPLEVLQVENLPALLETLG